MKKIILSVVCGIILVIMFLVGALVVWAVYDELTEEPLICEPLLEDDVELDVWEDDIQALRIETEELLQFENTGWELGRTAVRQERNNEGTMEYIAVYLYYRPKDKTESVHRLIYLLKENDRWIVAEASERNEEVCMDGNLSGAMLEEILKLTEEQMSLNYPACDEYEINMTSKEALVTVYQKNENGELFIANRLPFRIKGTETKYWLEEG